MGLWTAASRILGFIRDCLIAAAYGTSSTAQAFVVAFRIPNLLRDLVGEGAANSAFVPVFTRIRTQEGEASWVRLAQAIWFRVLVGFFFILGIGWVAAPFLVRLVAPGFRSDPALFELTVRLTRVLFPFVGLVAMAAFFMGLLNSIHRFALPSMGPVLLNLCIIAGLFLFRPDALGLAWGVIVGGFLQLAVQWPALRRAGIPLGLKRVNHPGVQQIGQLMVPRLLGTGVYQISVVVDTVFASFRGLVGEGGVASLYFANRFLHLPLALFGISMAQAALPRMSAQAAASDLEGMRRTCLLSLRSSLLIAVPASLGLLFLSHPIIHGLLERGAFSAESTRATAAVLQWYAVGIVALCATKVLANTLYALHDTWTPVRSASIALAANVVLNLLLVWPMGLSGLALATSLSATFNGLHLYRAVEHRIGPLSGELRGWLLRVAAAAVGMGSLSRGAWTVGIGATGESPLWIGTWLLVAIGAGILSFFGLAFLLRIEEVLQGAQWLRKNSFLRRD